MKSRTWMWMIAVYLFAALAMPVWTAAQEQQQQNKNRLRYVVTDLGTLGGTFAATPREGSTIGAGWKASPPSPRDKSQHAPSFGAMV